MDTVILRNLKFDIAVGRDAWRRPAKPQPVSLTLSLLPRQNFEAAALQDDVSLTLDYGKLYKAVSGAVKDKQYGNIQGLMLELAHVIDGYKLLNVDIVLPKALLDATGGVHYHLRIDQSVPDKVEASWSVAIKALVCTCIIGVNPHERQYKQRLSVDVILGGAQPLDYSVDGQALADEGLHDLSSEIVEVGPGTSSLGQANEHSESPRFLLPNTGSSRDCHSPDCDNGSPSANCNCPR
jgi:FolB domain-containing protein